MIEISNKENNFKEPQSLNFSELHQQIKQAPNLCGVYIFYNHNHYPLYIGKSIQLKQRLLSHYHQINHSPRTAKLFHAATTIDWQTTTGELGALLLESKLIKQYLPLFNKKLRKNKNLYTFIFNKKCSYYSIDIHKFSLDELTNQSEFFGLFKSQRQAKAILFDLIKRNKFCQHIANGFHNYQPCFNYQLKRCTGACTKKITAQINNQNLQASLNHLQLNAWPYQTKIAIEERCTLSSKVAYHIIDRWHYLGTVSAIDQANLFRLTNNSQFDKDCYIILLNALLHLDKKFFHLIPNS